MRSKRSEWEERVVQWRESGQTAAVYAESIGVKADTLRHWSWRLGREDGGAGSATLRATTRASPGRGKRPAKRLAKPTAPALVEVVGGRGSEARFEIELSCGRRVLVPMGFDENELGRLVAALDAGDQR